MKIVKKKVVFIQRTLKFYRLSFFDLLKEKCERNGIEVSVIYGVDDIIKFNNADLEWGIKIKHYKINLFGKYLYYQPALKYLKDADLVIVEQASKLLINYYLWILNLIGNKKLAFWGHGVNFQTRNSKNISEIIKKIMTRKIHRFFAYNDLSKRLVEKIGMPSDRITAIYNTLDTVQITKHIDEWDKKKVKEFKRKLGIGSNNICLFVGGMYKDKRLDFLLKSIILVKKSVPDMEFIFIGDGLDKDIIVKASNENKWIHYEGPKNDLEKVPYFLMSKLFLIPGLVGLAIIDTFIFGVPLITTDCKIHSPEIDYLENQKNGIIAENNITDYSSVIIDLLQNEEKRLKLIDGCIQSAKKYTIENMVDSFYEGISLSIGKNRV